MPASVVRSSSGEEGDVLELQVPHGWRSGAVQVEAMRGGFLSAAKVSSCSPAGIGS